MRPVAAAAPDPGDMRMKRRVRDSAKVIYFSSLFAPTRLTTPSVESRSRQPGRTRSLASCIRNALTRFQLLFRLPARLRSPLLATHYDDKALYLRRFCYDCFYCMCASSFRAHFPFPRFLFKFSLFRSIFSCSFPARPRLRLLAVICIRPEWRPLLALAN